MTTTVQKIVSDILKERARQNDKWGEQNRTPCQWTTILTEEVGEFAEAALGTELGGENAKANLNMREEAIHCAAVAFQILESIDRAQEPKV